MLVQLLIFIINIMGVFWLYKVGTVLTGLDDLASVLQEISKNGFGLGLSSFSNDGVYYIKQVVNFKKRYREVEDIGYLNRKYIRDLLVDKKSINEKYVKKTNVVGSKVSILEGLKAGYNIDDEIWGCVKSIEKELVDKLPKSRISLEEYLENGVAQKVFDYILSLEEDMFFLKFDINTKELYFIERIGSSD